MLYEGDTLFDVFILKSGIIKIYDIDEQGNEKILHLVKPQAIIPFVFFSGGKESIKWFYAALTDCEICVLPFDILMRRMRENNDLAIQLMNWFSLEVHELLVRLSSLGKTNTQDKLLAALRFLSIHHATQRHSGWWRVSFPVNHQLLADMTGVTRESTAMIMKEFREQHIIRNPRQTILEINLEKLIQET